MSIPKTDQYHTKTAPAHTMANSNFDKEPKLFQATNCKMVATLSNLSRTTKIAKSVTNLPTSKNCGNFSWSYIANFANIAKQTVKIIGSNFSTTVKPSNCFFKSPWKPLSESRGLSEASKGKKLPENVQNS